MAESREDVSNSFLTTEVKCNDGGQITLAAGTHFKHGGATRTRALRFDQYPTNIARCLMSVLKLLRGCSVSDEKFIRNFIPFISTSNLRANVEKE